MSWDEMLDVRGIVPFYPEGGVTKLLALPLKEDSEIERAFAPKSNWLYVLSLGF
jgi:hypothetical protein